MGINIRKIYPFFKNIENIPIFNIPIFLKKWVYLKTEIYPKKKTMAVSHSSILEGNGGQDKEAIVRKLRKLHKWERSRCSKIMARFDQNRVCTSC